VMVLVDDHSRYTWVYFLPLNDLWPPYLSLRTSLTSTERTQHCHYRQRLRSPRPEAMCSKQWEMYLVRLKQWEQRAQWEPKRQTGRRQEKMPSEVSRTSPSSEAGELDPRYARSPAPKPEPEPEEEQVPEGAGRFVTRSGRQWGLISNATTTMRRNLTIISVDAKQWQAAAHDEMTSLIKASVLPSPSLSCPRSSCFQQMGLQGQKAIRWDDKRLAWLLEVSARN